MDEGDILFALGDTVNAIDVTWTSMALLANRLNC